jgi:hypothetical protein
VSEEEKKVKFGSDLRARSGLCRFLLFRVWKSFGGTGGILLSIVFLLRSLEIRECVLLQIIVATSSVIVQGAQAIQDAMGNITGSRKLIDILS